MVDHPGKAEVELVKEWHLAGKESVSECYPSTHYATNNGVRTAPSADLQTVSNDDKIKR